ncbi:hypothetical protein OC845_005077 [Tilletia horrida]|nr:hypothetical protein OC845_005077 [Tilletia horrida]
MSRASKRARTDRTGSSSSAQTGIALGHPLRLKPLGNAFFSNIPNARGRGLGKLSAFSDQQISDILNLLVELDAESGLETNPKQAPISLCRLAQVSHTLNVFAYQESIWREAFLLRPDFNATLQFWAGSWRRTYALHHLQSSQQHRASDTQWLRGFNQPVTTPDLFSDHLFHSFIHALTPLGPLLPHQDENKISSFNKIDRIPASQYTVATFTEAYSRPNRPCIITDEPGLRSDAVSANRWPCAGWTLDTLAQQWPDRVFRAEAIKCNAKTYLSYARSCGAHALRAKGDRVRIGYFPPPTKLSFGGQDSAEDLKVAAFDPYVIPDESPFYLFDASFPATDKTASASWRIPQLLATGPSGSSTEVDLFALFGPHQRPDYRWLIAGPERSGSGWHLDPNGTSAWNTVLSGSKLWLMLPPGTPPPGVYVSQDEGEVTSPASLAEWVSLFAKATYEVHGTGKGGDGQLLVGVCHAGETCYVPSGWWHAVLNLEECVALTQNFVSPVELPYVLHFLKHKYDQISGFKRPRDGEPNAAENGNVDVDADDQEAAAASATGPRHQQSRAANGVSNGEERDFRLDIFDTFCKRLQEYDAALLKQGLEGMQAIEQRKALERTQAETAQMSSIGRKRVTNGVEASHVTWWERLKSGSEASQYTQATVNGHTNLDQNSHQSTFALGAAINDEELEDVPW